MGFGGGEIAPPAHQAYFSTDDGASWFTDSEDKIPPFQKDGKPAYRVYLYSCDAGATKFVGYMQRFTADAKAKIEQSQTLTGEALDAEAAAIGQARLAGEEVKKPKTGDTDKAWLKRSTRDGDVISRPMCPNGSPAQVMLPP
jgi:hypothetical protein